MTTKTQSVSFSDFFEQKDDVYQNLPVLGYDFWELEGGSVAKLYVGTRPSPDDVNRGGIIPMTYSLDARVLPVLKEEKEFPVHLNCLVKPIVGSKNKSVNVIVDIKK